MWLCSCSTSIIENRGPSVLSSILTIRGCRDELEFLDLLIAKENGAGPLDAAVRADLIDLMARVLVVVFQEEGRRVDDRRSLQFQNQAGAPGAQSDCLHVRPTLDQQ